MLIVSKKSLIMVEGRGTHFNGTYINQMERRVNKIDLIKRRSYGMSRMR